MQTPADGKLYVKPTPLQTGLAILSIICVTFAALALIFSNLSGFFFISSKVMAYGSAPPEVMNPWIASVASGFCSGIIALLATVLLVRNTARFVTPAIVLYLVSAVLIPISNSNAATFDTVAFQNEQLLPQMPLFLFLLVYTAAVGLSLNKTKHWF